MLSPADQAGVLALQFVTIADDGKTYAYSYQRELCSLFLVNGAR